MLSGAPEASVAPFPVARTSSVWKMRTLISTGELPSCEAVLYSKLLSASAACSTRIIAGTKWHCLDRRHSVRADPPLLYRFLE